MTLTGDDLRNALSVAAIAVSLVSVYFARFAWRQSNRPIVTALVTEHSSGVAAATFNLVVANTGNRPAIRVRLHTSRADLLLLVEGDAKPERIAMIEGTFLPESEIPLLRNGEELETSFGAFSDDPENGKWLKYGAQIEISITYFDLEGHRYESRLPLKIYARKGFGGGVWGEGA
jgi:hypothetical protein